MHVTAHHIISVHYTLTDDNNELIDSTYESGEPMFTCMAEAKW